MKVLLVDDHVLLLESLKTIVETDPNIQVVAAIADPSSLLEDVQRLKPDIILMDIRLKSHNGLSLTKEILQQLPDMKIIILSGYDDDAYIHAAQNAGARGFVKKEQSNEELIAIVKAVYEGATHFPYFEESLLTLKEREVLQLVAWDQTNEMISRELAMSKRTVENHISSILRKLGVDTRLGAAVTGIEQGLVSAKR